MSKYNNIKSIPIESIPKEEIKIAIKEWAEGNKSLENLLWLCYEKNLKTSGSHAGARPFIDFKYQEGLNKMVCLFERAQTIKGSDIYIQIDGVNPFSGEDFDKAFISIGNDSKYENETDSFFDLLSDALKNNMQEKGEHPLLKILNFLNDKGSGLNLRLIYNRDDSYDFSIESSIISEDRYKYYSDLFKNAGMVENKSENKNRYEWQIKSNNLKDILKKIDDISNVIINNFSLEPETDENKITNFILLAKYKKKTLSKNDFENWLKDENSKFLGTNSEEKENAETLKMSDSEKKVYVELKDKRRLKKDNLENESKKALSNKNGFVNVIYASIILIVIVIIYLILIK